MYYTAVDDKQTEADFVQHLRDSFGEDNIVAGGKDTAARHGMRDIHDFPGLRHMGFGHFETAEKSFIRFDSPGGVRFYRLQDN